MSTPVERIDHTADPGYWAVEVRLDEASGRGRPMHPHEPAHDSHVFRVTLRSGAWHVSRDGVFFGDYLSRGNAIRAAYAAARHDETHGLMAQVFEPPGATPLPHHEPHFDA